MAATGIVFNSSDISPTIAQAIQLFQDHYLDESFLNAIRRNRYHFTQDSGEALAQRIQNANVVISVETFHDSHTRAIASTSTRNGMKVIKFNTAYQDELSERVKTIMHEFLHTLGYSHLTNFNWSYNRGTVPYKAADIFVNDLRDRGIL